MTGTQKAKNENVRIEKFGFIADIVFSPTNSGGIYHYVIQRTGSPEIVHWGQEISKDRALECVEDFLRDYQPKGA